MAIPGFTAHRTLQPRERFHSRLATRESLGGVRPAMMILVDGVPYCEGEITDGGVQCYGGASGGGGGDGRYLVACRRSCAHTCGTHPHAYPAPCYKNCVADC
jgi:hypothetical protein